MNYFAAKVQQNNQMCKKKRKNRPQRTIFSLLRPSVAFIIAALLPRF